MNRQSLIGYRNGQGFIYNLSAVSKLLFFLAFSVVAMVTYDTRLILCIAVFSLSLF
jgi:energy-coupling factor transport system permease protein